MFAGIWPALSGFGARTNRGVVLWPPVQGQKRPSSRVIRSTLAAILEGAKMMIGLYRSVGIVATIAWLQPRAPSRHHPVRPDHSVAQ
jgi:hypothetical protein